MIACINLSMVRIIKMIDMKKIFLLVVMIAATMVQTSFSQDQRDTGKTDLLSSYYALKDALVAGSAPLAAKKAGTLVTAIESADDSMIGKAAGKSLLKHTGMILESKDLESQRKYFSALSADMITLVKTVKQHEAPVYEMYCPMKKSSWLSSETTVKNPYYGNAMLNCGKITATIK